MERDFRKLEKTLSKQRQETRQRLEIKRQDEKMNRIAIAKSIVDNQPVIGDMKMMDKNAEELLKILLKMYKKVNSYKIQADYNEIPEGYRNGLSRILDTLQQYGIIFNYRMFMGGGFQFTLSPQALTYFEDKEKTLEQEKERQKMAQNINIQNLTATGSNINFGSILNSTLTAQNIVSEIEKQIEEKGGDDKAELKDLLEEVKELCESIKVNNPLPNRVTLMTKISKHFEKHNWFYGSIVQLLGTAAMSAMKGGN